MKKTLIKTFMVLFLLAAVGTFSFAEKPTLYDPLYMGEANFLLAGNHISNVDLYYYENSNDTGDYKVWYVEIPGYNVYININISGKISYVTIVSESFELAYGPAKITFTEMGENYISVVASFKDSSNIFYFYW